MLGVDFPQGTKQSVRTVGEAPNVSLPGHVHLAALRGVLLADPVPLRATSAPWHLSIANQIKHYQRFHLSTQSLAIVSKR